MIEILANLLSTILTIVVVVLVAQWLDCSHRKKLEQYHITYEYRWFSLTSPYSFHHRMAELKDLGDEGWEVAASMNHGDNRIGLLLKRETLHTSKKQNKEDDSNN